MASRRTPISPSAEQPPLDKPGPERAASRKRATRSPGLQVAAETAAARADKPEPASAGEAASASIPAREKRPPVRSERTAAASTGARSLSTGSRSEAAIAPAVPHTKQKLVRDSFTMPQADFALIQLLKERALEVRRPAKKSELLRAGLHALALLDAVGLEQALDQLEPLKAGRPKKVV